MKNLKCVNCNKIIRLSPFNGGEIMILYKGKYWYHVATKSVYCPQTVATPPEKK